MTKKIEDNKDEAIGGKAEVIKIANTETKEDI